MVPAEEIVRVAQEEKVDFIGLSGLITPSLDEMVYVARELRTAGIQVPIMIGGATTSKLHTALKIAPVYEGPVIWMKDAAQNVMACSRLTQPDTKDAYVTGINAEYNSLREKYLQKQENILSLEEARKRKLNLF